MKFGKLSLVVVAAVFAVFACVTPKEAGPSPVEEKRVEPAPTPVVEPQPEPVKPEPEVALHTTTVFRGVDANANGRATLSPSQFRFNPTLSTFNNTQVFLTNDAGAAMKDCAYAFTVTNVAHDPAQPNDTGTIVLNFSDGGVTTLHGVFDNNPPGHWGFADPDGGANAACSAWAQANRGGVRNAVKQNCN